MFATRFFAKSNTFPTSSTRTLCSARIPFIYCSPARRAVGVCCVARLDWCNISVSRVHHDIVAMPYIILPSYIPRACFTIPYHHTTNWSYPAPSYHKLVIQYPYTISLSYHVIPSWHYLTIPYCNTVPYHRTATFSNHTIIPQA